jgi:hypothetical protein
MQIKTLFENLVRQSLREGTTKHKYYGIAFCNVSQSQLTWKRALGFNEVNSLSYSLKQKTEKGQIEQI